MILVVFVLLGFFFELLLLSSNQASSWWIVPAAFIFVFSLAFISKKLRHGNTPYNYTSFSQYGLLIKRVNHRRIDWGSLLGSLAILIGGFAYMGPNYMGLVAIAGISAIYYWTSAGLAGFYSGNPKVKDKFLKEIYKSSTADTATPTQISTAE